MHRRQCLRRVEVVPQGFEDGFGVARGSRVEVAGCSLVLAVVDIAQRAVQRTQARLGLSDQCLAPGQALPVVSRQQGVAQRFAVVLREQLADRHDVAEALGHLLAGHGQHAVVQPVAHESYATVCATALRRLVLVMRECQVAAAAVDVDDSAQMLADHRRALDVPAWSSASPGAWPAGQFRGRGFPEDEVLRILLVRGDFDPGTVEHVFQASLCERAVLGVGRYVEQHVAVGRVGVAGGDQLADHRHDLVDVVGGARLDVRGATPSAATSRRYSAAKCSAWVPIGDPLARAAALILSSMSVMFRT